MSHEADQLEGFGELLETCGRTFSAGGQSFRGIVRTLNPETEGYDLTPTDDDTVSITAVRSEVPDTALRVGAGIVDGDGFSYRVTRIRRSPNQPIVRLECTVVNP